MAARILVIEDDAASLALTEYLLHSAGHTTLVASDGGTGFGVAVAQSPDLVICDLQMPVLNGYEVAQRLRADPCWRPVPLIAVTAFSMPGDCDKALAAGFDAYFSKPITPETFVRDVEAFLPPDLISGQPDD